MTWTQYNKKIIQFKIQIDFIDLKTDSKYSSEDSNLRAYSNIQLVNSTIGPDEHMIDAWERELVNEMKNQSCITVLISGGFGRISEDLRGSRKLRRDPEPAASPRPVHFNGNL